MSLVRRLRLADDFSGAVSALAGVLRGGGVAVFPTETVYGLGAAFGDDAALARLRRLKGRDSGKPFQILAAGVAMGEAMGARFNPGARRLAARFWPGPLTLVVPDGTGSGTLGLRVPDSAFVQAVIAALGRGIVATSANPAGQPPPLDADAADAFPEEVDLLVDGGPCSVGVASDVVRCADDTYTILREGALGARAIASAWSASREQA